MLTRVTELVEGHDGLAATVPEVVVIGMPAPADIGRAVDAALAEVDRRNAPGESVPAEPPAPEPAEAPAAPEAESDSGGRQQKPRPKRRPTSRRRSETEAEAEVEAEAEERPSAEADPPVVVDETADQGEPEPEPAPSHTEAVAATVRPTNPAAPTGPEWVWVLDDTVAPMPTALLRLVEAVRRSRSVGMAGPKVVRWENPRLLVELGRQVTRAGRRVDAPTFGEADQGQYDTRTDVLAVGTAGMLVRREVYEELDGFEPAFAAAGADLDLGWRAQLAGQRVVVVPGAVVRRTRSAAERQAGPLATRLAERRAARRVALTRCSPLAVPLLVVWLLLGSVLSAIGLLLVKRPQHAWAEISDIGALGRPFSSAAARWRFRQTKTVRRRHLTGLFVGSGAALGATWDRVQDAVVPERTRTGQLHAGDAASAEPGPVAEEAEALTGLPPSLPQRIATHPGFLAVLVCAALSAVTFRNALSEGVLDARGPGFAGGELYAVATSSDGLWHLFRDSWHGAGFGNALDVSPFDRRALRADLAGRVAAVRLGWPQPGERHDVLADPGRDAALGLTAYLAARVATRARWARGLVALAWGTSGVLTAALTQGRVSVVVAHILLPLVVVGFGAALKRDGTWTATFAGALATGLLGVFVPVAPRRLRRRRHRRGGFRAGGGPPAARRGARRRARRPARALGAAVRRASHGCCSPVRDCSTSVRTHPRRGSSPWPSPTAASPWSACSSCRSSSSRSSPWLGAAAGGRATSR